MNKLSTVAFAAIFAACNSATTTDTGTQDSAAATDTTVSMNAGDTGWITLFDGTTLNGWHTFGSDSVGGAWGVDSSSIHLNSSSKEGRGDLVSNESYENFDLKLDWKISKAGNSGILFYVQDDKKKYGDTYKTGPEMQVLDDERHEDRKKPSHRAGSLYDMIQATPGAVKPAEQWNAVEIVSNNGKLDFYLNGVHVVNTTMWDDNWKKMLADSKFKEWPEFGTFKSGHIALQDHGNDVWYRNIMIKKL